ncbi:9119_t:CDS:2, partial [Funneliformis mosseae]
MITKDRWSQYKEAQKKYPNYIIMARSHVSGQIFWELQKPELIEHPGSFIKGTHDPEEFQEHLKKYKKYEKQSGKYYEETKILEYSWYKEFEYTFKRHYHQTDTVMAPRRVNFELSAGTYEIVSSIDQYKENLSDDANIDSDDEEE